jgi:ribosomal protein L18E
MAFDVSALANYTKENEALLVTSSVLGSKTAS